MLIQVVKVLTLLESSINMVQYYCSDSCLVGQVIVVTKKLFVAENKPLAVISYELFDTVWKNFSYQKSYIHIYIFYHPVYESMDCSQFEEWRDKSALLDLFSLSWAKLILG